MQKDPASYESLLNSHGLTRFKNMPKEKVDQLLAFIIKKKKEQLKELADILIKANNELKDLPYANILLKQSILDCELTQQELVTIFKINATKNDEDQQLRTEISKLQLSAGVSQRVYEIVYQIRHLYLLNKPKQFYLQQERLSDRLLHKQNGRAQYFLESYTDLSAEERALIDEFYPKIKHADPLFLRKANSDFSLSIAETIIFVLMAIQKAIEANRSNLIFEIDTSANHKCIQVDLIKKVYFNYTNKTLVNLLNNPEQLKVALTTKELANSINFYDGSTLLANAIELSKETQVAIILEAGANPNFPDSLGMNALHLAIKQNNKKVFDLILSKITNINAENKSGNTAMHLAAFEGKEEYVVELLAKGADPNLNNSATKNTALHISTSRNHEPLVKLLLANKNVDSTIRNQSGHTAAGIAIINSHPLILQLFKDQLSHPLNSSAAKAPSDKHITTPVIANPLPALPKQPALTIDFFKLVLRKPRANRDQLNTLFFLNIKNPFIDLTCKELSRDHNEQSDDIRVEIRAEKQTKITVEEFFKKIQSALEDLIDKSGGTFGQAYIRIYDLAEEVQANSMPVYAFAFELARYKLIDHLINLVEDKNIMAVAIEGDDTPAIKDILKKEPNRSQKVITFSNVEYSEIKYAIQMGRFVAVREMLSLKDEIPNVDFGEIPENPVELAHKQHAVLKNTNPALLEAQAFHSTDIPLASRNNWRRLMYTLLKTLPKDQPVVNHFFTKEEYDCVRVLLSEKDIPLQQKIDERTKRNIQAKILLAAEKRILPKKIARLKTQLNSEQDPKTRKTLAEDLAIFEALPQKIDDALVRIQRLSLPENMTQAVTQSHNELSAPPDAPLIINEYIHATNKVMEIIQQGKILTVNEAIIATNARSGTPEGARNNIFFNINSPLTRITPFRSAVNALVKLNPIKAIRNGLLKPNDIYCSPHLSAFDIERVENPIMFIGEDPSIVTVYRICHIIDPLTKAKKKVHRFDYYKDGKLIYPSTVVDFKLAEEFFRGDNTKSLTYRLLLISRWIQGSFASGSYRDYFLKNINNATVINSLKAAIFNVFNIEGKISKSIENIDNDAIEIIENPKARHFEPLSQDTLSGLFKLIEEGNLAGLQNAIRDFVLYKEQLGPVLVHAAEALKPHIVQYLLEIGVNCNYQNNAALYHTLVLLQTILNKGEHHPDIRAAHDILLLLLERGSNDEYDQHIRYPATPDSCTNSNATWSDISKSNLEFLQDCLQAFEGTEFQKLLVSHINKPLQELYQFTFQKGLFNSHIDIAKRLNQKTLFERADIAAQLQLIDDNNIKEIEALFRGTQEPEHYTYLLYWAIKQEQSTLFPFLTRYLMSSKTWMNQAITFAIKNKSNKFIQCISLDFQLLESSAILAVLNYSLQHLAPEETQRMLSGVVNLDILLKTALSKSNNLLAKFIIDQSEFQRRVLYSDETLKTRLRELAELTVQAGDKDLVASLVTKIVTLPPFDSTKMEEIIYILVKVRCDLATFNLVLDILEKNDKGTDFANHICALKDPKYKDHKIFTNDLDYLVAITGIEAFERLITFITRNYKHKNFFIRGSKANQNYLHVCLAFGNLLPQKLKAIQKRFPELSLLTEKYNALNLYEMVIKQMFPHTEMLDELLLGQHIDLPTTLQAKIRLLAVAAIRGHTIIIAWLIEKNYLSKGIKNEKTNQNLLQLLFEQISNPSFIAEVGYDDKMDGELEKSLEFIVTKFDVDLGHQDNNKKTILLYPLTRPFIKLLLTKKCNFSATDSNGNTPFHLYDLRCLTVEMIDKYCQLGGVLTALNADSDSVLENYLLSKKENPFSEEAVLSKLRAAGCQARDSLLDPQPKYHIFTCINEGNHYVLADNRRVCFFNKGFISVEFLPLLSKQERHFQSHDGRVLNIIHYDCGKTKSFPSNIKKALCDEFDPRWVSFPITTNEEETKSTFLAILTGHIKENRTLLSAEQFDELAEAYSKEYEHQYKFFRLISCNDLVGVKKYIQDDDILKKINSSPFVFYAYTTHASTAFSTIMISPLNCAILFRRDDILKYLISVDTCWRAQLSNHHHSPINFAIEHNNPNAFDFLLTKTNFDFRMLNVYLTSIPDSFLPHFLPIILKHANKINKVDLHRLSKGNRTNIINIIEAMLTKPIENKDQILEGLNTLKKASGKFKKGEKEDSVDANLKDDVGVNVEAKKSLPKRTRETEESSTTEQPKLARSDDKCEQAANAGGTTRFFLRRKPAEALPHSSKKNRLDEKKDDSTPPSAGSSSP